MSEIRELSLSATTNWQIEYYTTVQVVSWKFGTHGAQNCFRLQATQAHRHAFRTSGFPLQSPTWYICYEQGTGIERKNEVFCSFERLHQYWG